MPKNKKATLLVTGALGHIGSQLIRDIDTKLVSEVRMLDNLESQRYCSLFHLPLKLKYRFAQEDIRTGDIDRYLEGVDLVMHLAAITNAEASHERQKEVEEVNFDGLKRVAESCLKKDIKILFPSTTSVYGSQASVVDETCEELKPQSPYAEAKLASEKLLTEMAAKGLKHISCRFGTIFGPSVGMRFHTAVNKFMWQAMTGQPITVWKTAWKQRRPYLDLRDCIASINFILEKDLFEGGLYNVLTRNFTVEDIVTTIRELIPGLQVAYVDSPIMNQLSYDVDDAKFRKLGFSPSGDLREGLRATLEHFKQIVER